VRAQRFLKGEDALNVAWVGSSPALGVGTDGSARQLPDPGAKRDASGQALDAVVAAVGARIG
jgi:DNA gyrase subunit A